MTTCRRPHQTKDEADALTTALMTSKHMGFWYTHPCGDHFHTEGVA